VGKKKGASGRSGCGNTSGIVLIDGSHYTLRPLSLVEMKKAGYNDTEILAGLVNPARVGVIISNYFESSPLAASLLSLLVSLGAVYGFIRIIERGSAPHHSPVRVKWVRESDDLSVLKALCRDLTLRGLISQLCEERKSAKELATSLNGLFKKKPELLDKIIEIMLKES